MEWDLSGPYLFTALLKVSYSWSLHREFNSLTRRPTDWNSCRMDALERPVYGYEGLLHKDFFTVADYFRILNI